MGDGSSETEDLETALHGSVRLQCMKPSSVTRTEQTGRVILALRGGGRRSDVQVYPQLHSKFVSLDYMLKPTQNPSLNGKLRRGCLLFPRQNNNKKKYHAVTLLIGIYENRGNMAQWESLETHR